MYIEEELKFGRHDGNPYAYSTDVGVAYRGFADWLDIGAGFKKEYEKDGAGLFRHENRPHLSVTLKGRLLNIDTSNRFRIEYRDREHIEHEYRFRNKTTFKFPLKLTRLELQPYIAEEWFINLGESDINQNRLSAGLSWPPNKNVRSSLFYMWKASRGAGGWVNTNIIGTDFKFLF